MMGVPLCAALLLLLCVCLSESCTCGPGHPQEFFCMSDIVMRAEVTGEKIIPRDENIKGMGEIQHDIKVIEVFKGSDRIKQIQHVYSSEMSSMCGTRLDPGQYLLTGDIISERFSVTLCDFITPWDSLSVIMKNNFKHRYEMGCDCKIITCTEGRPCPSNKKDVCMLPDWSDWSVHDQACIRHNNGSCGWFTETDKPSTNDTMDATDLPKSETPFTSDPL